MCFYYIVKVYIKIYCFCVIFVFLVYFFKFFVFFIIRIFSYFKFFLVFAIIFIFLDGIQEETGLAQRSLANGWLTEQGEILPR